VLVRQGDKDDKVDKGERVCFFVASSRAIAYESEKPTPERIDPLQIFNLVALFQEGFESPNEKKLHHTAFKTSNF
jgi:hypothetical protein